MKHVIGTLAAALTLALALSLPAYGQQRQATPQAEVVAAAFTAEVTGKVQNVDPQSGVLTLQTTDGPVNVRFPAAAVQTIKPGDTVTVAFGLVKEPPSASPPTSPGSKSK
jgi:Flp pilus assembly protein TadG